MVQSVRTQASEPYSSDDRVVTRLLRHLDVDLIVGLLKVDIVCKSLSDEATVDLRLAHWRHVAICESKADSLQILAIVAFHEKMRQFK